MRAKAPWARGSQCEKWAEKFRAGVNEYMSQRTESWEQKISPLIWIGEGFLEGPRPGATKGGWVARVGAEVMGGAGSGADI